MASLLEVHQRLADNRSERDTVVARVSSAQVPPWSLLRSLCNSTLCVLHGTLRKPCAQTMSSYLGRALSLWTDLRCRSIS